MPQTALRGPDSQRKHRLAIVAFPYKSFPPYKFLTELIIILEPISAKIVLIGGNTDRIDTTHSSKIVVRDVGFGMHYLQDIKPKFFSAFMWIFKWFLFQCRASLELVKARAEVDVVIFYMAYPGYLLPLVVTKLLRKKSIEVVTRGKPATVASRLWKLHDPILFALLDGISPESRGLIKELGIEKYGRKLLPDGARFIDSTIYKKNTRVSERENYVGFIGRISKEKGIIDLIHAIPLAAAQESDLKFMIVGAGPLTDWVREQCNRLRTERGITVTWMEWIDLPDKIDYYNGLKLFVLPTHNDAFPTTILEAMACGTPVLATPVGAIPDMIADEDTGFLLESNAPESIAQQITAIVNYKGLEEVSDNAESFVKQKFARTAATERYDKMLKEVLVQRDHF